MCKCHASSGALFSFMFFCCGAENRLILVRCNRACLGLVHVEIQLRHRGASTRKTQAGQQRRRRDGYNQQVLFGVLAIIVSNCFASTIRLFDAANTLDPNQESDGAVLRPKELLYAERMSEMLARFAPDASEAVKLAVRAQHIRRWTVPRNTYPMTPIGYKQWRTGLYKFHAETAGMLMREAGYDDEMIARVHKIVAKQGIKANPETQLMEDVVALVFLEHYLTGFATLHPEYDEAKWCDIIRKTWQKMSAQGRDFVLAGKISLPEALVPLILKAVGEA